MPSEIRTITKGQDGRTYLITSVPLQNKECLATFTDFVKITPEEIQKLGLVLRAMLKQTKVNYENRWYDYIGKNYLLDALAYSFETFHQSIGKTSDQTIYFYAI